MIPTFTWPDWKQAPKGTRFRNIQTGRTGTLVGPAKNPHNGAIVVWDERPFPVRSVDGEEGHVFFVAIAHDAEPINVARVQESRSAGEPIKDAPKGV